MLLICPVRPGDSNDELRYALRSWETNLILRDGLELWTVGHCPEWLAPDRHIPGNHYAASSLAVFDNVLLGAEAAIEADVEEVLYMNDDFFCLDPVGLVLPVRRNCSLAVHLARFPGDAGLWWPRSLRLTGEWLVGQGFPDPASYELHRPFPASPQGMAEALYRWMYDGLEGEFTALPATVPQWRTLYGVLNKVEAHPIGDAKLGVRSTGVGTPWISTSDSSWRKYGPPIKKRFQKPSRWEREIIPRR